MPKQNWRDEHCNENAPPPRAWCQVLTTEGHAHCDKPYFCGCECHLPDDGRIDARWRRRLHRRFDPGAVRVAGRRQ